MEVLEVRGVNISLVEGCIVSDGNESIDKKGRQCIEQEGSICIKRL